MKLHQTYWSPFPTRVRLVLYAKGIDVEIVEPTVVHGAGMAKGGFQGVGAIGRVPTLELDDGRLLGESEVICEYLEDAYPTPSLRPKDPWQLAQVRLLSRLSDIYVVMAMVPLFWMVVEPRSQWNRDKILAASKQLHEALTLVEEHIGTSGYAVGTALSHADGTLIPILMLASAWAPQVFDIPNPLDGLPKLAAYWKAIGRDPIAARLIEETASALKAQQKARSA